MAESPIPNPQSEIRNPQSEIRNPKSAQSVQNPIAASPFALAPTTMLLIPLVLAGPLARHKGWQGFARALALALLAFAFLGIGLAFAAAEVSVTGQVSSVTSQVSSNTLSANQSPISTQSVQSPTSTTITYTYDPLYRLTGATSISNLQSPISTYQYTYDAAGNRQSYLVNGTQVATYTYNAANWLTQVNAQSYTYDDNGNLINDGTFGYTYDSANRLTQLVAGALTTEYEYNGDGVRIAQIADGLRTDYVQDLAAPLPQVLSAEQGGTVTKYLRGLGLIGEQQGGTGPLAGVATWQYHLPDALGSVRQVTDAQGQVQLAQRFDPFGGLETQYGLRTTQYGFAGEEQDPDTDQLFLRARTYNPGTGRFLQQDKVFGSPNDPRTLHRYSYGFNNPVNYTDPSGLMPPNSYNSNGQPGSGARPPLTHYGPPAPTQLAAGGTGVRQSTLGGPGYAPRSSMAVGPDRPTYSDPTARAQSQGGHGPANCGLSGLLGGFVQAGLNGELLPTLVDFGLHSPQILQGVMSQEQWLHLLMGSVIIGGAVLLTGGAALPVILAGAAIGAGLGTGLQMWDNYRREAPVGNIDWGGVAWAAFDGAVAGAIAAVIAPLLPGGGSGLVGAIGTGFGEFVTGRATQVGLNLINGQRWDQNLWNLRDIALDVIPGVGAAPLARAVGKAFRGLGRGVRGAAGAVGDALGRAGRYVDEAVEQVGRRLDEGPSRGHYKGDPAAPPRSHDIVLPEGRVVRTSPPTPEIGSQRHNYILEGTVYPPEKFGVTPEIERAIMKSFPPGEDRLLGLRDRPQGATSLDGRIGLDAKAGWVRDWAILEKHNKGIRELIDANKLVRGEYSHVTRGKNGWIFEMKGDKVFVKDDKFLPFVDNSINRLGQEVHANTYGNAKLVGQQTLSDVDGAFYAGVDADGNWVDLGDAYYKREFMEEFNKNYTVGGVPLPPRQHLISHGVFSDIPEDILKKLGIIPNRIEGMLAEQTLIYAHLPSQNIYGFYAVVPFEEIIIKLRLEKFAKYR